jgi:hypothetical protein
MGNTYRSVFGVGLSQVHKGLRSGGPLVETRDEWGSLGRGDTVRKPARPLQAEYPDLLITGCGAQLPVQRSQRDFPARGDLQIGSVVNREPVALG